jgi:hypothetical protein
VAIVIIIAIVVAVYVVINNRNNNNNGGKRSLDARGIAWGGDAPVAAVYAQSKIVIDGAAYDPEGKAPLSALSGVLRGGPGKFAKRYVEWSKDEVFGSDSK